MKPLHELKDILPLVDIVGFTEETVDVASEALLVCPKKQQRDDFSDFFYFLKIDIFTLNIDA